jgi:hypothetical protein
MLYNLLTLKMRKLAGEFNTYSYMSGNSDQNPDHRSIKLVISSPLLLYHPVFYPIHAQDIC